MPVVLEPQGRWCALLQVLPVGMLTEEHEERGPSGKPHSLAVSFDKLTILTNCKCYNTVY